MLPKLKLDGNSEYWLKFPNKIKKIKGETSLTIQNAPIGKGSLSYAFKLRDNNTGKNMIAKISKTSLATKEYSFEDI